MQAALFADTDLTHHAATLDDGASCKVLCPACQGGSSGERSLRLRRTGGTVYATCYRASCGWRGRHTGVWYADKRLPVPKLVYTGCTRDLLDQERGMLMDKFSLTDDEISGLCTDIDTGRIVFPLHDMTGKLTGHVLRSYTGQSPKTLTYGDATYHCPIMVCGDSIIVVEDAVSAIKCARYMPSMAILGTKLTDNHIAAVKHAGVRRLVLCLDQDAIPLSHKYKRLYEIFFQEFIVLEIDKDIKDMDNGQLERLMEDL